MTVLQQVLIAAVVALFGAAIQVAGPGLTSLNGWAIGFFCCAGVLAIVLVLNLRQDRQDLTASSQLGDIHPASSTPASLQQPGARTDPPRPVRFDWRETEERFRRIQGEVSALWSMHESGVVEWQIHAEDPRIRERFLAEAEAAGKAVVQIPDVPRKFSHLMIACEDADNWLNVVTARLDPIHNVTGSGYYRYRGGTESGTFERLVEASQILCAQLVHEVPPGVSPTPQQVWAAKWNDLANRFRINRDTSMHVDQSGDIVGNDWFAVQDFKSHAKLAGKMLLISPRTSRALSAAQRNQPDSLRRWLDYVAQASSNDGGMTAVSAAVCERCAIRETSYGTLEHRVTF